MGGSQNLEIQKMSPKKLLDKIYTEPQFANSELSNIGDNKDQPNDYQVFDYSLHEYKVYILFRYKLKI